MCLLTRYTSVIAKIFMKLVTLIYIRFVNDVCRRKSTKELFGSFGGLSTSRMLARASCISRNGKKKLNDH